MLPVPSSVRIVLAAIVVMLLGAVGVVERVQNRCPDVVVAAGQSSTACDIHKVAVAVDGDAVAPPSLQGYLALRRTEVVEIGVGKSPGDSNRAVVAEV